jgi:hypothetical protein
MQKSPSQWTAEDCMTVILAATTHNIHDDQALIKVCATPFSPLVLNALTRIDQRRQRWNESQFEQNLEVRLFEELGLLYDIKTRTCFDHIGHHYEGVEQIDSLIILVDLMNTSTCAPTMGDNVVETTDLKGDLFTVGTMRSLLGDIPMSDLPCFTPDISHVQDQVLLENDQGKLLKPNVVWGRTENVLTGEQHLLALFQFRWGSYHFLTGCKKMYLNIAGLGNKVHLQIPVSAIR